MRVAVLVDGGHLRDYCREARRPYNDPAAIDRAAKWFVAPEESLFRILYYDCAPFQGEARLPISKEIYSFDGSTAWIDDLMQYDFFAVRLGVLKFRGWMPLSLDKIPTKDEDFKPRFEQKGVDMRIGLDVASFSHSGTVDRIILMTNDTDCVPALKYARRAGIQTVLAVLPGQRCPAELRAHVDFTRYMERWP